MRSQRERTRRKTDPRYQKVLEGRISVGARAGSGHLRWGTRTKRVGEYEEGERRKGSVL